jgi:hypothetical protein
VSGVSTRFRLQIEMIPRCEPSLGPPQGLVVGSPVVAIDPLTGQQIAEAIMLEAERSRDIDVRTATGAEFADLLVTPED